MAEVPSVSAWPPDTSLTSEPTPRIPLGPEPTVDGAVSEDRFPPLTGSPFVDETTGQPPSALAEAPRYTQPDLPYGRSVEPYPMRFDVAYGEQLSRAKTFFRIALMLPAYLFLSLAVYVFYAAIVAGCKQFEPGMHLAGVILNRTAGDRHRAIL